MSETAATPMADRQDFRERSSAWQDPTHNRNFLRSHTDSLLLIKIVPSLGAGLKLGHRGSAMDVEQLPALLTCPPWLGCLSWWEEALGTENLLLRSHWDGKG